MPLRTQRILYPQAIDDREVLQRTWTLLARMSAAHEWKRQGFASGG